jgi:hypothetical protein
MSSDTKDPLDLLENSEQLLAFAHKSDGEFGVRSLFGDDLYGREFVQR